MIAAVELVESFPGIRGDVAVEKWTFARPFITSQSNFSEAELVVVRLTADGATGSGEGCPILRHHESVPQAITEAREMITALRSGALWRDIYSTARAGVARNAVDCAIWDLRAKQSRKHVWQLLGMSAPKAIPTALTIGLDSPEAMARSAASYEASEFEVLKLKLGTDRDLDSVEAVRDAVPNKRLIVDPNGAWTLDRLGEMLPRLKALHVEMIEQPTKPSEDHGLKSLNRVVPVAADEACRVASDVPRLLGLYDVVNIKLDKCGGLTEAIQLLQKICDCGLEAMIGCMNATSLAIAPAMLIGQYCRFVDLDGPLLLGNDRVPGIAYRDGCVGVPPRALWG